MTKETKLQTIATVSLGKAFRTAIKDLGEKGNGYLIQISNINSGSLSKTTELAKVAVSEKDKKFHLESDDILVPVRGNTSKTVIVQGKFDLPMITTNQVAVIKAQTQSIVPYYLHWYLNSPHAKRFFQLAEGSNIMKVSMAGLKDMPVTLPPLEIQHKISAIYQNWLKQKSVYQGLITSGDVLFEQISMQLSEGRLIVNDS